MNKAVRVLRCNVYFSLRWLPTSERLVSNFWLIGRHFHWQKKIPTTEQSGKRAFIQNKLKGYTKRLVLFHTHTHTLILYLLEYIHIICTFLLLYKAIITQSTFKVWGSHKGTLKVYWRWPLFFLFYENEYFVCLYYIICMYNIWKSFFHQ